MAQGDLTVFDEGKLAVLEEYWNSTDEIWIGIVTDVCVVTDPKPGYGAYGTTQYTPIATAGNYAAGGLLLDTLAAMLTEVDGVVSFKDTGADVSWAMHASNPDDGDHAVVYHKTSGLCIAMIDLAGPVIMSTGTLTITWHASGIYTLT